MKILRTYLLREHLGPFLVTVGGLTVVLLVGNMIKFADLVISKGVNIWDILRLVIYLIPYLLSFTIPMACLVAIVMAFGRLSTDYELIAMRASGIAPVRLVLPMLVLSVLISGGIVMLNDRVIPDAHLAFRRQLKAIGIKQPTAYIEAGTFIKEFAPYVMFVYQVEGKTMLNVRIYEPRPQGPTRTIVANRGEFEPIQEGSAVRLTLYEGTVDEWDPQRPGSLYKVSFGTYTMNLSPDTEGRRRLAKKLKEMTFRELLQERARLIAEGIDALPITIEFHRKVAASFSTVIFVLFGLAMGLRLHHHERLVTFVWILGVFVAYYLATIGVNAVAFKGWMPAWLATWLPNLAGLLMGGISLAKAVRR